MGEGRAVDAPCAFGTMDIRDGDRRMTSFMWSHISDEVRAEFEFERIRDADAFHRDVMDSDRRVSFWRTGEWVASMWSGWLDWADGLRSFGCVVRRPDELKSRLWLGLASRHMADFFFGGEPEGSREAVVLIPAFMKRCVRHAVLSGLEDGGLTEDGVYRVMRKDLDQMRKGGERC